MEGNARNIPVANAINFFSAKDPRLPANYSVSSNGKDTTKSQDGSTFSRTTSLYDQTTSVAVTNGIDARLIEAEADLAAGGTNWLTILNTLRASPQTLGTVTSPVMPALTDPGTVTGRQDLLFREWAFWTFSRGQRLENMRRLVRYYGRAANTVYPEGQHYRILPGTYGSDLQLPVPQDERNNPKFKGCTNRDA